MVTAMLFIVLGRVKEANAPIQMAELYQGLLQTILQHFF